MSLDALSRQLWRQRATLEAMLFKLEEVRLLSAAGADRWLPRATQELDDVTTQAQMMELERALESTNAATELGLAEDASLQEIIDAAPNPWPELLTKHRESLIELTAEITEKSKENQEIIAALKRDNEEMLSYLMNLGTKSQAPKEEPVNAVSLERLLATVKPPISGATK